MEYYAFVIRNKTRENIIEFNGAKKIRDLVKCVIFRVPHTSKRMTDENGF